MQKIENVWTKLFRTMYIWTFFDPIFGWILDVIVRGQKINKESGRKRGKHKIYNLRSLSSFFSYKTCFYSNKCLNGCSSRISLLSIASVIKAFLKVDLITLQEFRNLSYRLISHPTCAGFILDNLVSILIWWACFPLFRPFVTSFMEPRFQK